MGSQLENLNQSSALERIDGADRGLGLSPVGFAGLQQAVFDASVSPAERKDQGHFGTPNVIADFMAGMFSEFSDDVVRVLDAGAGVGTLSAAMCERAISLDRPRKFHFELWENDPKLIPLLENTMCHCQQALVEAGHAMTFEVRVEDFILGNRQKSLFNDGPVESFDFAILNPPYFKLRKESAQAQAMKHVVHGQPNIYALFMAAAADLLVEGGELVAITPRSYFNGLYFKRFRKWFFDQLVAKQIHVFGSRKEAFKDDAVLQENVILKAEKGGTASEVLLTTSTGRDLSDVEQAMWSYSQIIDDSNGDHVVRVPTSQLEADIVSAMDQQSQRLQSLGFEISTGPVVTFRSTEHLRNEQGDETAPLLWMHNVRPFITQFPEKNGKPTHIAVCKDSKKLLLESKCYVLLKRFTAKEEKRRLVAGIFKPSDSYCKWIGFENHLNYIYKKNGELTEHEALGIAAYFNSELVDRYFRVVSGNTQVNATEIRGLPMPDKTVINKIGKHVEKLDSISLEAIECIVCESLGLSSHIYEEILKVGQ